MEELGIVLSVTCIKKFFGLLSKEIGHTFMGIRKQILIDCASKPIISTVNQVILNFGTNMMSLRVSEAFTCFLQVYGVVFIELNHRSTLATPMIPINVLYFFIFFLGERRFSYVCNFKHSLTSF